MKHDLYVAMYFNCAAILVLSDMAYFKVKGLLVDHIHFYRIA